MTTSIFQSTKPAQPLTIVGFGQGGGNIANEFAGLRNTNRQKVYTTMAVNTNKGDLTALKNIPASNHIWFGKDDHGQDYNGFGKDAEKGTRKIHSDKNAQKIINDLIKIKLGGEETSHIVFVACEGGGTGTSVLNEAVKSFYKTYREPIEHGVAERMNKIKQLQDQIISKFGEERGKVLFEERKKGFLAEVQEYITREIEKKRLFIIITLPQTSDGGDVLRQVSNYTSELWEMVSDDKYGIGHMVVVDNQHIANEYEQLTKKEMNLQSYINNRIVTLVHELNVGSEIGGTSKTFDGNDLSSLWYGGKGIMFYGKETKPVNQIQNETDIIELFTAARESSHLHGRILHTTEKDGGKIIKKIHHVLLFAVLPANKKIDGVQLLQQAQAEFSKAIIQSEDSRFFTGYIEDPNSTDVSVYVAYKIEGLPERLETGLLEEYEEFKRKRTEVSYASSSIQKQEKSYTNSPYGNLDAMLSNNAPAGDDENLMFNMSLEDLLNNDGPQEQQKSEEEENLDDLLKDFKLT